MSSDQGTGAPSFGDLFDDPDAPETPVSPAAVAGRAAPATDAPAASTPSRPTPAAEDGRAPEEPVDLVSGHDLDHESAEGAHLVAGFEQGSDDEPEGTEEPGRSPYDSVMIAPLAAAMAVEGRGTPPVAGGSVTVAPATGAAPLGRTPVPPVTVAPAPWDGNVDRAVSSAPAPRVDTGRLYRSSGAEGPATLDAIPAIDPDYSPAQRIEAAVVPAAKGTSGLTYTGVAVVVVSATVIAGFLEAVLRHEIGAITGLALAASSIYAAVVVRRVDIWAAVVVPPLAFLAAALTAGQLTLDRTGHLLIREGFSLFRALAVNAPWILGTTLVCLAIVLVRRRRD